MPNDLPNAMSVCDANVVIMDRYGEVYRISYAVG